MPTQPTTLAPGARIVVRDGEWRVRRVDTTSSGGQMLTVVGMSELVRDKEAVFLTEIDRSIKVLDPAATELVPDTSRAYQASLLYIESLLRQTPPTDENLYIGHRAAMDAVDYQLDPALQALEQPRQRILIADAVGLGKTLEAGVLLAELIRRGRGKRILVLAVKSMLTQFQKEMWSRFTIPLTRLDSVGLQRVRSRIPTNHNPFYYFDKAIISIDTLKQDAEYRAYLEKAYWDVIVIDEAHNVAERGAGASQRAKLARLLAGRSDTLIMLSATPHDGKARSFASLMNMLDPTAIANPDDYGPEDIKGLFIRRFKKDIQGQVERAFKQREIRVAPCHAAPPEESAYDALVDLTFTHLDRRSSGGHLFKTTLEKALFSSPAACLETIRNRVAKLRKEEEAACSADIAGLEGLAGHVEQIDPQSFSKYQRLLTVIHDPPPAGFGWRGNDLTDRLVIFTERIETLRFLRDHLPRDLGLRESQVETLHGTLSDLDQQRIVEDFGREEAPVRLLIASDVASEGINLHYLCHRMVHFDIPWSLMVFQQRNGRIDRYGQARTPQIVYLTTESDHPKIRGDQRILQLLIEKDQEAVENIGDPSIFMGVYDIGEEERFTARAIEAGQTPEAFEAALEAEKEATFDPLALLMGGGDLPAGESAAERRRSLPTLYEDDFTYLRAAIDHLRQSEPMQVRFHPNEQRITLTAPEELHHRFRFYPKETWPADGEFVLSADQEAIQAEIARSRKDERAWPRVHYLWELNPVVEWVNDKVVAAFGRHQAPVLTLSGALAPDEVTFLLSGLIPNRKGHPLIHRWFAVPFRGGHLQVIEPFDTFLERTALGRRPLPNRGAAVDVAALQALLPEAVAAAHHWIRHRRTEFEAHINAKLNEQLAALERLKEKQYTQLDLRFQQSRQLPGVIERRKEEERRRIERLFDDYLEWVEETMTTEEHPYLQVIAAVQG